MAAGGGDEYIMFHTDFAFTFVMDVLTRVRNEMVASKKAPQLLIQHIQTASIENIESANSVDVNLFGGGRSDYVKKFFVTASAVLRMCMMKSAGIPEDFQPVISVLAQERNFPKVKVEHHLTDPTFVLANNMYEAQKYYSAYDHLYPHFVLEHGYTPHTRSGNWWSPDPTLMLILRNDFSELIDFSTTFRVREKVEENINGFFDSYAYVVFIVRKIPKGAQKVFHSVFLPSPEAPLALKEAQTTWEEKFFKEDVLKTEESQAAVPDSMLDIVTDKFEKIHINK